MVLIRLIQIISPLIIIHGNKIVDGVNLGVGISSTAARAWWTNSSSRSAAFQSLGTVSSLDIK